MSRHTPSLQLARLLLVAASALGCQSPAQSTPQGRTQVTVFAASSLTEAFRDVARAYEAEHPDVHVALTFAGSQVLRLQLEQGARADLFASANEAHVRALADGGVVSRWETFARNRLVLVVPLDNPAGIHSFADLHRARRLVIGSEHVPVGRYARQVLARAGTRLGEAFRSEVQRHVVSQETNVRLLRAKVELGEADAALVYRTDALASDSLRSVPIPKAVNAHATYAIGLLARSRSADAARTLMAFVRGQAGQRLLEARGFEVSP